MFLFIDNIVKIASLHGIAAIINAMSTHKENSGVQKYACGALRAVSRDNNGIFFYFSFCHFFTRLGVFFS